MAGHPAGFQGLQLFHQQAPENCPVQDFGGNWDGMSLLLAGIHRSFPLGFFKWKVKRMEWLLRRSERGLVMPQP